MLLTARPEVKINMFSEGLASVRLRKPRVRFYRLATTDWSVPILKMSHTEKVLNEKKKSVFSLKLSDLKAAKNPGQTGFAGSELRPDRGDRRGCEADFIF